MAKVEINGSVFEVVFGSVDGVLTLRGARGATHSLVRNLKSGRHVFLRGGTREETIRTLQVVA